MNRASALVLSIIFLIIFTLITYYGARVKIWSSFIFSIFVSLILLNLLYPVEKVTTDNADFTLIIYALYQIIGIIILGFYITEKSLGDVRNNELLVKIM